MTAHDAAPGAAQPLGTAPLCSVSDAVAARRSIRAYTDQPVDPALLRQVLDRAQRAASGGNVQPWQVTVMTGAPLAQLCAEVTGRAMAGDRGEPEFTIYPDPLPEPWKTQRAAVAYEMYAAMGIARDDRAGRAAAMLANFSAFGAPVLLFVHCRRLMGAAQWADMGIWFGTLLLLLREAGLDSCPQEAWTNYGASVRRAIALGDDDIVWTGLAIGHGVADAPVNNFAVPRLPIDQVVQWHGFDPA
ncbi:MAG: nitroreductase [Sphingopyxis sp.]